LVNFFRQLVQFYDEYTICRVLIALVGVGRVVSES
jgi:hypothetical protein